MLYFLYVIRVFAARVGVNRRIRE